MLAVWGSISHLTATSPNTPAPTNSVITTTGNDCDLCNADVGFDAANAHFMNLQQNCSVVFGFCGPDEATHEFGHVLGKHHRREDKMLILNERD